MPPETKSGETEASQSTVTGGCRVKCGWLYGDFAAHHGDYSCDELRGNGVCTSIPLTAWHVSPAAI